MSISALALQTIAHHTSIHPQDRWYAAAPKFGSSLLLKVLVTAFAAFETLARVFSAPILVPLQGCVDWSKKTASAARTTLDAMTSIVSPYVKTPEPLLPLRGTDVALNTSAAGRHLLREIASAALIGSTALIFLSQGPWRFSLNNGNSPIPFIDPISALYPLAVFSLLAFSASIVGEFLPAEIQQSQDIKMAKNLIERGYEVQDYRWDFFDRIGSKGRGNTLELLEFFYFYQANKEDEEIIRDTWKERFMSSDETKARFPSIETLMEELESDIQPHLETNA